MNEIGMGGIPRPSDKRDFRLGLAGAPTQYPEVYFTDLSKLPVKYQSKFGTCGGHAGSMFDSALTGIDLSPKYLWRQIKQIDGYPLEAGTDMRSIFKSLQNTGDCTETLSPNTIDSTLEEYSDHGKITDAQLNDAYPRGIDAYAFLDNPTIDDIKRYIYTYKVVIALVDCGSGWYTDAAGNASWAEKDVLPLKLGNFDSGHFIVLYGYDKNNIYFRNSWSDKWGRLGDGYFNSSYIKNVREIGAAIAAPSIKQQLVTKYTKLIIMLNTLIALLKNKTGGAIAAATTKGKWQNTVWRTALAVLLIGVPVATQIFPTWQDITLGTIVFATIHWLEGRQA